MEKVSKYIVTNYFGKHEENDEKAVLVFGVQRFLEDVTKIIFISIVAMLLGILKEVIIVFLVMMCYKNFIGGAHANSNIVCIIVSTIICLFPIYFSKFICFSQNQLLIFTILTIIFSLAIILMIAPADTKNVPIVNKKQRLLLKLGALAVLSAIIIIFGLIIKDSMYYQIALIVINISNLNTTPIIYKIFGCKYSYGVID